MGLFTSRFSEKTDESAEEIEKNRQKNFDLFKYDGIRARHLGQFDYAVKCFTKALSLQEDFETMGYLAQTYIRINLLEEAYQLLEQMREKDPTHLPTLLLLANVCYMQENYARMGEVAQEAIAANEKNALAYYQLAQAVKGQGDKLMCIAHLTKAILLEDDFTEARLLRAETLTEMQQYREAMQEIEVLLTQDATNESALLLRGRIAEITQSPEKAEKDYRRCITELNPFNEEAYLRLGKLYIAQKRYDEAITLFDEAIEMNADFAQAYSERERAKLLKSKSINYDYK